MNLNLKGKNALVCGSTQGLGKAAAVELAHLGANIILMARSHTALEQTLKELPNQGQEHGTIVADFSSPEEVQKQLHLFSATHPNFTFHILVNNTGGPPGGLITEAKIEEFERAFAMHLKNNHLLATFVMEGMKSCGYGRIINIISTSVKQPLHGLGVSNTIRGAVASWAKTMANELGKYGITVNNVLPGATATARLQSIIESKAKKESKTIEVVEASMKSSIPAARFGKAEEIGAAVAFLASPAAGYINGINLPVDGGRTGCL